MTDIDLREKLADIDNALASHDRKRQEISLVPWQIGVTLISAAAAFFAAGAVFVKVFV